MRNQLCAAVSIALGLVMEFCASPAAAGPVEEFTQILLHPTDPQFMIARYVNSGDGLFFTTDGGQTWRAMCASMMGPGGRADGSLTITSDNQVLVTYFGGLFQGSEGGCAWSKTSAFDGVHIADVVTDPSDPHGVFAVKASGDAPAENGLYYRGSSGAWSALGPADPSLVNRVRVVPNAGGLRIYESLVRGTHAVGTNGTQAPNYFIRVSDDKGMTFRESSVTLDEGTMRLEAVDQTAPDRIVISVDRVNGQDSIMVSDDQGAHFREYLSLTQFGGLSMAPDGRIWIGDLGDSADPAQPRGLFAAPNLGATPTKLTSAYQVRCVSYQPATSTLYVCQRWSLGTADPSTGAFEERLSFKTARDFLSCPSIDSQAVCKTQLCNGYCGPMHFSSAPLCANYSDPQCGPLADPPPVAAAGAGGSGGTTAAAGAPAPQKQSSGCSAFSSSAGDFQTLAALFISGVAIARRRKRNRTPASNTT